MPFSRKSIFTSIIGAGKVGSTLGALLSRSGYPIESIIDQKKGHAQKLARFTHCKNFSDSLSDVSPQTRFLLIATPEEILPALTQQLGSFSHLKLHHLLIAHTSGIETSDVFLPLIRRGAIAFSLHPIQTFAGTITLREQLTRMPGIVYGFEGNNRALYFARQIVRDMQGSIIVIPKEKKILYHTACVFASNYTITTLSGAERLLPRVSKRLKLQHLQPLIYASVANVLDLGAAKALTGPIVRGSINTVYRHLKGLRYSMPELLDEYKHSGLLAVDLARKSKALTRSKALQIKKILLNIKPSGKK